MASRTDSHTPCQVVSIDGLPALVQTMAGSRGTPAHVIHYKGFGPAMDVAAQQGTLNAVCSELLQADVIQFDGDDLDPPAAWSSFTCAFHHLLTLARQEGKAFPTLLAFKMEAEYERFCHSWSEFISTHGLTLYVVLVPESTCSDPLLYAPAAGMAEREWMEKGCHRAYPEDTLLPGQAKYVALGAFAIDTVRQALSPAAHRQRVVVWGGYQVIRRELAVHIARRGREALPWAYYHAWRTRNGERQEGQLLACEGIHPCLTVCARPS